MQTNLSVQTVQTNCGGKVGGGICKSRGEVGGGICKSVITYTFANPPSHLSPAVGLHSLHGEVGLHLIRCLGKIPIHEIRQEEHNAQFQY